MDKSY